MLNRNKSELRSTDNFQRDPIILHLMETRSTELNIKDYYLPINCKNTYTV
jgi:hypothetical protein